MVCEEHVDFPPFPCAWPNCPNGVDADEIEVEYFSGSDPKVSFRDKWEYGDGHFTYVWQDADHPFRLLWLDRLVGRELARRNIVTWSNRSTTLPIIYHYTSLAGFMGIIESGEIWLSDPDFLNDKYEFRYGIELAKKVYLEIAQRDGENVIKLFNDWLKFSESEKHRSYVASFSYDRDSLSQWRGYGPICLGFEYFPAVSFGYKGGGRDGEVIYDEETQLESLKLSAELTASAYKQDCIWSPGRVDELYENGGHHILSQAALLKHPAFKDEKEFRLVYSEYDYLLASLKKDRISPRFRIANGSIVPYITTRDTVRLGLRDSYPELLPLKEVIIGPSNTDTLYKGVKEYLLENGYSDVRVEMSKAPLRS